MSERAIEAAKAIARLVPMHSDSRWSPGHGDCFPAEYTEKEIALIEEIAATAIAAADRVAVPTPAEIELMMFDTEHHRAGPVYRCDDGTLRVYYAGFNLTALSEHIARELAQAALALSPGKVSDGGTFRRCLCALQLAGEAIRKAATVSPGKGEGWREIEVAQLQPNDDCPGLWIGFKTAADRERAMAMFTVERGGS